MHENKILRKIMIYNAKEKKRDAGKYCMINTSRISDILLKSDTIKAEFTIVNTNIKSGTGSKPKLKIYI